MTAIGHATEVEIQYRQRLEALYEAVGIIVKYYTLVKQSIGVEDFLKFLHNIVGLIPPLVLNKRSHISTGAVFGLKRTVIALNHKFCHITHHFCIASHLVLIGKTLIQYEMIVALKCVTIDTGIIVAMISNQLLQLNSSLWQRFYWECHIFYQARCAHRTCTAYAWEYTTTYGPVLTVNGRILGKFCGDIQAELAQALLYLCNLVKQLFVGYALGFCEYRCQVVIIAWLYTFNLTSINILLILQIYRIINRTERLVVEHFGTLNHQILSTVLNVFLASLHLLHCHHSLTTLLHGHKVNHSRSLERIVF